ncbi:MAG: YkvA family protein [Desulfobacterales bacterium]
MTEKKQNGRNFLTIPLSERGIPVFGVYFLALVGLIYLLNPGGGLIELIPDNIPFIGNMDEGGATLALWYGLLEFFESRKRKK